MNSFALFACSRRWSEYSDSGLSNQNTTCRVKVGSDKTTLQTQQVVLRGFLLHLAIPTAPRLKIHELYSLHGSAEKKNLSVRSLSNSFGIMRYIVNVGNNDAFLCFVSIALRKTSKRLQSSEPLTQPQQSGHEDGSQRQLHN